MSEAKAFKDQYEQDLKALQERCEHIKTHWAIEAWAPAHYTGKEIEICDNCWKQVAKRQHVVEAVPHGKLVERKA